MWISRKLRTAPVRRAKLESLENRLLLAVVFAGDPLVNVDATSLREGRPLSIPNNGTLGGVFVSTGPRDTIPVIGPPVASATSGTRGVRMDGTDFLQLRRSVDGTLRAAPGGITGPDPTLSVEAWAWNPGIALEETMVAWGKRGTDGSNMSFNYGYNNNWGAVGHWATTQDIGWGSVVPAARQWHHLAYTYDGTTSRVYVDGQLTNTEVLGPGQVNIWPDTPINIGSQTEADATTPTPALRGSLTLGRLRIHDGVLTDRDVEANYEAEKADFVEPAIPPPPAAVKLVDVDPTALPEGPAQDLVNTGTLGGFFEARGGGVTVPVIDRPMAAATAGTRGIRFDGNDFLQSVIAVGGAARPAPVEIVGANP